VQQIQCNCPEGEKILPLGRKRHGAAQRQGRKEEGNVQAAAGGQPVGDRPDGGSPVEGEMAEELLAVPGSSGVDVSAGGSAPPVPAEDSAAAAGPPTASPMVEPATVQPSAPATEHVAAVELKGVELSVPAAEAAAAALVAEAATALRLVSEALSGLALGLAAAKETAAGVLAEKSVAAKPAAVTAVVSAVTLTAAKRERPVLASGPVAASKECWVMNPGIGPKVIMRRISSGPTAAAAEAAASGERQAGEPVPGLGLPPVVRLAAAETKSPPVATTS
jgi:hypothetical protein